MEGGGGRGEEGRRKGEGKCVKKSRCLLLGCREK